MRQPYLIYKKNTRDKKALYVKVWDDKTYDYSIRKSILAIKDELGPKGQRFPHTSKAGANALVQLWLKESPKEISPDRFDQYLLAFWREDSDFLKGQAMRGKTYSAQYIKNNYSGIENYFIEFLDAVNRREIMLHQVKPDLLESFLSYMTDKGKIGTKRINDILQAVKVALSEAHRLGRIDSNPGTKVRKLQSSSSERKIFSKKEAKEFLEYVSDPRQYAINLVAATAGLRLGECRGLLHEDIKDGYIDVQHNWQDGEGLKEPKWGSSGQVPIPPKTQKVLKNLMAANPYGNNFVFWGRIRYYGLMANRNRSANLSLCLEFFHIKQKKSTESPSWDSLMLLVTGVDVNKCPNCGEGALVAFDPWSKILGKPPPVRIND